MCCVRKTLATCQEALMMFMNTVRHKCSISVNFLALEGCV